MSIGIIALAATIPALCCGIAAFCMSNATTKSAEAMARQDRKSVV